MGKDCEHNMFKCVASIDRLCHDDKDDDKGPVTGYAADITINCTECGIPFRFLGLAAGSHYFEPRVSVDGLELRAPIEPATHQKFVPIASYTPPPKRQ